MKTTKTIIWGQPATITAIALAKLGWSDLAIEKETGLTPGQISYRLRQDATVEALEKGVGHRKLYRNGGSTWSRFVMQKCLLHAAKDVRLNVLPKAVKPPAEVVAAPTT